MKRNAFFCLCLCFCILFSACSAPVFPEESSVSAAESSVTVPVIEDETAQAARAYLEELLAAEQATGKVGWLTSERAGAIRACVKQLKAPFLIEEDVLRIAKQALSVVSAESAWSAEQSMLLPACGVLETVVWSPAANPGACESFYKALVAYTLYLFTPPDYLFREEEVLDRVSLTSSLSLYLPLALPEAGYASRGEALVLLREGKNGVELPVYGLGNNENPLDCSLCGTPVLFRGSGEVLTLDLEELAQQEHVTLPEDFFIARAEEEVRDWMGRILDRAAPPGVDDHYTLPNGMDVGVYQLLPAEAVQEIREKVEMLPAPVMSSGYAGELVHTLLESPDLKSTLLLLPGVDGAEDVYLPPGAEHWEDVPWQDESILAAKAYAAAVYLIDLFTPSACRFTDLTDREGTYYALDDGPEPSYLFLAKENGLFVVFEANDMFYVDPLFITWVPWEEGTE